MSEAEFFTNALEIESRADRDSYLNQVCGEDSRLRKRLQKLLDYSSVNGDFLEQTPVLSGSFMNDGFGKSDAAVYESPGDMIGPYKLLQKIGEGGMGTVFMADQHEPIKRRVAVKVIKPGMDSDQVLARFETERQSLLMMDHLNIARALDVGTTARGRPYFVMELVKGVPITRYCDDHRLDTKKRLSLFIPLCYAIQHAHVKGIIHRDLKPSNVLVAEYDNQAVPKVIDFGVAKAMDGQLTQKTMFTQLGQVVGTVEYMSPEQSKLNQLDVDTRSDVYSLGVLLYELLTGSTPIQGGRLKELAWDELTKMIREVDPPLPSLRIRTSETIADIAACRQTEPGKLSRLVRGELDWIVMKALDKDRSRRYQTANDLALDVQRFLDNEAVVACPPSTYYQLTKFAKRHRFVMLTGVLVALSLMLGLIGTLWQSRLAVQATILAEKQRDLAISERQRAQEAEQAAAIAAEKSNREAEISRAIGNFLNKDLLAFADPDVEPDRNIPLRKLLDRATRSVGELQSVPEVEAALRQTLATAFLNLGEYREADTHAARALELRRSCYGEDNPETIASLLLFAEIRLKRSLFREASRLFQEAVDHSGAQTPLSLRGLRGLGVSWHKLGRLDAARDLLSELLKSQVQVLGDSNRDSFETRRDLAEIQLAKGHYRDSKTEFSSVLLEMTTALGKDHPLTLKTKSGLATTLTALGDLKNASLIREEILASQSKVLGPNHPDTLLTASSLTTANLVAGKISDAESAQRQLVARAQSQLGDRHLITIELSNSLADLLMVQGKLAEAKQYFEKSQESIAYLLDHNNPTSLQLKYRYAGLSAFSGMYEEALSRYQEVLDSQRLVLGPNHTDTLHSMSSIAEMLMYLGRYQDAETLLVELIRDAQEGLGPIHPIVLQALGKQFTLMSVSGSLEGRVEDCKELIALCDREHGAKTPIAIDLAVSLAESLGRSGYVDQSLSIYEERLPHSIELFGSEHTTTLRIQDSLATAFQSIGKVVESKKMNEEVLAVRRRTLGETHPLTLRSLNNLGTCSVNSGDLAGGEKFFREAYNAAKGHYGSSFPATLQYGQNLASTLGLLKNSQEALKLFEEILSIQTGLHGQTHPDVLFTKLGLAGFYAHQERFVDAENLYRAVLESERKLLGKSHVNTLRCLENLSIVVGEQHRYEDAIQLCKEYLVIAVERYPDAHSTHKMVHACIEYHIALGRTLDAKPFFEQSIELVDRYGKQPDWLINDLRFLAFAQIQADQLEQAIASLKHYAMHCQRKLGDGHPTTLQAKILLGKWLKTQGAEEASARAFDAIINKLAAIDQESVHDGTRLSLVRALVSSKPEDLAGVAAEAAKQESWLLAASLYGQCASWPTESSGNSDEFRQKALDSLAKACRGGQVTKMRELALLKTAPEFDGLRASSEFKSLVARFDARLKSDHLTKLAWSYAMAGDHSKAKDTLNGLQGLELESGQENVVGYNAACVHSICFGVIKREASAQSAPGLESLGDEYLKLAIEKLQESVARGYLSGSKGMEQLRQDIDFDSIRSTDAFQKILALINGKIESDAR